MARPAIQRAIELDPELAEAHASKGLLHEINRELGPSLNSYKRAVQLDPTSTMALMWYGNALSKSQDVLGAHEQYQKALEHDPLHPVVQQNFLRNMIATGSGQQAADMAKAMHEVSGEERLLKPMFHALTKMGKFDAILEFLVRYNFSEEHQEHSLFVISETLINLHRFDQAKALLANQERHALFEGKSLLIAKLAVAERDASSLNKLVEDLKNQSIGKEEKEKLSFECVDARKTAWLGLADFMESKYTAALTHLLAAEKEEYLACDFGEDRHISLLLYIAETYRMLNNDEAAANYFDTAKARIDKALSLGWGEAFTQQVLLAYYLLTDQTEHIGELLERLNQEQINPWSGLINNPIVDRYINEPKNSALLKPFQKKYQETLEKSRSIPLAKYGID